MKNNEKWILLTAGFYPKEIQDAAFRVAKQAEYLHDFSRIIVCNADNIAKLCPKASEKYSDFMNTDTPFYGYSIWKAEMIQSALNGNYGECDGIIWVDAGCEIFASALTKIKFNSLLKHVKKYGYGIFDLDTPEIFYTNRAVFSYFDSVDPEDRTPQVQATYFALHGENGRRIAQSVFDAAMSSLSLISNQEISHYEHVDFQIHKSEQSILSLTCKALNFQNRMKVPPAGNRGFLSLLKAAGHPIWVSRNRTGVSLIPVWMNKIALFSIKPQILRKKTHA
jgi:hypothetical protein